MVMGTVKAKDTMEAVSMEEVAVVKEYMVEICISPITPGMLLKSNIFLGIAEVPIGRPFRGRTSIC